MMQTLASRGNMKQISLVIVAIVGTLMIPHIVRAQADDAMLGIHTYAVDKTVDEMPPGDDFSSPERAYATMQRRLASGNDDWRPMSLSRLGPALPKPTVRTTPLSQRVVRGYLDCRIVEVRKIADTIGYVLARWPNSGSIDVRWVELEEGKWLSAGNSQADSIEDARKFVEGVARKRTSLSEYRAARVYPQNYIQPFIAFLRQSAKDPKDYLIQSIADHQLVIIGQVPHRPAYWELLGSTINDPRFARSVSTVYLPLPANLQGDLDAFLASRSMDTSGAVEVLRNVGWMGEPDAALLEFIVGIRRANMVMADRSSRLRVVLVGEPIDWKRLQSPPTTKPSAEELDAAMARRVLDDLKSHNGDARHALLLVDAAHAPRNLRLRENGEPIRSAGYHLARELKSECFIVLQHAPQMSASGSVMGRTRRGLFDSAFKALDYKPAGFSLSENPFGGEPFDAITDWDSDGHYQDAGDGYLFLERLEAERFSPLIEGFYTSAFMPEVARRHRLIEGFDLVDRTGIESPTGADFTRWLSTTWGQPQAWRDHLGSIDAWQLANSEMP
jgi:hypothetical protein